MLFLFAVVGGVTTVSGALLGGALFALLPFVQSEQPDLAGLVFAAVAAVAIVLGRQPTAWPGSSPRPSAAGSAGSRWRNAPDTTPSTPTADEAPLGAEV